MSAESTTTTTVIKSDKEQLEALKKKMDTWKQSARQQLEDAQKKNESLRRQLESVSAERDTLRSKEEDRSVACDALVSRAVSLQEKLSATESKLQEEIKHSKELKRQHAEQIKSLEEQISHFRSEQERLMESLKKEQQQQQQNNNTSSSKNDLAEEEQQENNKNDNNDDEFDDLGDEKDSKNTAKNKNSKTSSSSSPRRLALLEQQIEERDCRIAVLNALYSQVKAEATKSSAIIANIRDEHSKVVDQLRSSIATMTVQVASKSSALENAKRQLEEANQRAQWFEGEVQRLRQDAAERERAFAEIFTSSQQQQQQAQQQAQQHHEKTSSSPISFASSSSTNDNISQQQHQKRKQKSSAASSEFLVVSSSDNDFDDISSGVGVNNNNNNNNSSSSIRTENKKLIEELSEMKNVLASKEHRCRHLETRVEEQQTMVRNLAKQLQDTVNIHAKINSGAETVVIGDDGDDEMSLIDSTSPSKYGDGRTSGVIKQQQQSNNKNSLLTQYTESFLFSVETTKQKLHRLFQRYKVLAPAVVGVTLLVFFMIWFSRGSGPTVNRVDMFVKRNDQLEQELAAVREAYSRLNAKCKL